MMPVMNSVRPSRDGDQFHYLWAARRCLLLLSPQTDLVGVGIEGPSPDELPPESATLAGEGLIDIAEYYGYEEVSRARLVRYVQLKHSSLRAADPWTASGLEKTLTGFSARYKDLLRSFNGEDLAERLEFCFVTNRPISSDFTEAVVDAAQDTAPRHPNELEKLERFTGLKGASLSSFFSLIRFEDRQDDYWEQRNILDQEISGYLPGFDVDAPMQLKELVTRKALSISENNPIITKMDVLRTLGTDESRLYPAPCLIKSINNIVLREQQEDLIQAIVQAEKKPVIVHALAGVGKSVFSTRIPTGLPEGSVSILYDCFGNGQYRSATGYRHRHQEALVQIANELAAKGLCHPLIPTVYADAPAYVRAFIYRLQQAVTIIRRADPSAVLCIVIDAADNAQLAAEETGQSRSFARDLLRETLPDGVRLVILCRSHRTTVLDPPPQSLRLELKPFSKTETTAHLHQIFPDASEHDVNEFHRLSSQNPRLQAFALSRNLPLAETLRLLGPNPTTVESAIGSLLNDAIAKLRDSVGSIEQKQIDKICVALAALRPLIPVPILSRISGVSEEAIRSFALDLGRPLHLSDDTIQFLDEPVETWFRERFKPTSENMVAFIRNLKPLATNSAYVASILPQLMLEAGQFSELVELSLTSASLPETSPLEKHSVELQRLQFALKASLRLRRYPDAAKIALKAGGKTAGDDRRRKIIQSNTDLASLFLETELVQEVVSRRTFDTDWRGSHNAYEAGLMSGREGLIGDARSRLRMAYEWLHNWSRLTRKEREDEKVSDADVAELGMAQLNIHGANAAARSIGRWRPREVSFRVGRILASRLIDHGRFTELNDLAVAAGNNLCLVLAVVLELRAVQRTPPCEVVDRAFRLVSHSRVKLNDAKAVDINATALDAVTGLAEAALKLSLCSQIEAAALLARYLPLSPRGLSSRFSNSRSLLMRAYCLRAAMKGKKLQLIDLAHKELKTRLEEEQHHSSQEVREFKGNIGALLPWHELRATTLLGGITKEILPTLLEETRKTSNEAAQLLYGGSVRVLDEIALIWFDVLNHLEAIDAESVDDCAAWIRSLDRPLSASTLTAMARQGAQKEETSGHALRFAAEAFELIQAERNAAEYKSSACIKIARSVLPISGCEAEAYFSEAVGIASKIGDENLARWDAILDLADRAARRDRTAPKVAYQFARCAELTWGYVARDKHFDWVSTVRALSSLCPSSSLAILSRWRDRGFARTGRVLPIAMYTLIENGCVDPRDVLVTVGFKAEWDYPKLLGEALDKCDDRSQREAASKLVYRYMKWEGHSSSVWSGLKKVTKKYGLSLPELDTYISFEEKKERTVNQRETDYREKRKITAESPRYDWDEVFFGIDLTTDDGISRAYSAFKSTPVSWNQNQFFTEAFRRVPLGDEAAFIAAFRKNPTFDLYDFRDLLKQIPDAWKGRPSIRRSLETTLKFVCRRFCMDITNNRRYQNLPYELVFMLTGISEAEIGEYVLDAIAESPNFAESDRLFSLLGLLKSKLKHDEALEVLTFGLSLFDPVLEDRDGDGPWSDRLAPPTSIPASIAGYLYAGLAAPAAMIRWQAAHAVLILCALGRVEVLRHLMIHARDKSGGPFTDAQLPFYQLHGLQWLMIAFARAAIEFPAALAPLASQIAELALDDQPHVMIKQFAARAALALIENGVSPAGDRLVERLSRVNVTPFPFVESSRYQRVPQMAKDIAKLDDEDRFFFGIDIGPYWYEPLGEVFALSRSNIESKALNVIRNELTYLKRSAWNEDERQRRGLFEYPETSASHGLYPNTDNMHFYLCYHAMMTVAGRLLETTPTHRDTEWGEQDEFAEWLSRHDLSRKDGRWLADRRDPSPLEWTQWRKQMKDDPAYGVVTRTDLSRELMTANLLNVWGEWSISESTRLKSVRVRSALVTPDRSMALVRALSTVKDVHCYRIPSSDDDLQINRAGFVLKGWVEDHHQDERLDNKDYWSGGIRYPLPAPSVETIELMTLETDADNRLWNDGEKTPVMSSQVWGHIELRNQENNPEYGNRLQASRDFVKDLLNKINHDLIVEVEIEIRRHYWQWESRQDNGEKYPRATKLYLIKSDGGVTTL